MAAWPAKLNEVKVMGMSQRGKISGFLAVLFLLQSMLTWLPMPGMSMPMDAISQSSSFPQIDLHLAHSDSDLDLSSNRHLDVHSQMHPEMDQASHGIMAQGDDQPCQIEAQACAEMMCANLVFDEAGTNALVSAPMQSVNLYVLDEFSALTFSSLYRPPISLLS